jgi:hypothetical protein
MGQAKEWQIIGKMKIKSMRSGKSAYFGQAESVNYTAMVLASQNLRYLEWRNKKFGNYLHKSKINIDKGLAISLLSPSIVILGNMFHFQGRTDDGDANSAVCESAVDGFEPYNGRICDHSLRAIFQQCAGCGVGLERRGGARSDDAVDEHGHQSS